jgi:hypothetical protein
MTRGSARVLLRRDRLRPESVGTHVRAVGEYLFRSLRVPDRLWVGYAQVTQARGSNPRLSPECESRRVSRLASR